MRFQTARIAPSNMRWTPQAEFTLLFSTPPEAQLADGLFGKQAPDMAHIYFRYPDKANVYLVRGVLRGDLGKVEVNSWRSRDLIDIAETKIQAITIEGKGFKTELVRTSTEAWTMNGKAVDSG